MAPSARSCSSLGSTIDLSGLAGVAVPLSEYNLSIKVTARDVADSPLAQFLIGQTVMIDARLGGTRADGVLWVGSPLLDASGYARVIPKTIDELLIAGGSFKVATTAPNSSGGFIPAAVQNFIQEPGSVINVSGGYVSYQGGAIQTTQLLGSNGRVYDIGAADPTISYVGIAGQFAVNRGRWGASLIYSDPLFSKGRYDPGYIAGASAGAISINAVAPVLDGAFVADLVTGGRQRALAQGGGTAPQVSLAQLPDGASLNVTFGSGPTYSVVLEPQSAAGPDPYGLGSFSLATATSWTPTLAGNAFPIFSDSLSAAGFGSITISPQNGLREAAAASLTVQPGGAVTLGNVTEIDGAINAPSGSIALTSYSPIAVGGSVPPPPDLIIGSTALLNVRGLWVNDTGAFGYAAQGSAFVNGGSVSISTPAASAYTTQTIASGVLADGTNVAGLTLVTSTDVTQSIVLAPGSVIDASSGGYVGSNGQLKYGSDGLPLGKGGSVTLQTYKGGFNPFVASTSSNDGMFSGVTTAQNPVVLGDGSATPAGATIDYFNPSNAAGDNGVAGSNFAPTDGVLRANVVMGGSIYAAGFDGGGTFSLGAPSIRIVGGGGPVISYLPAASLAGIAAATGQSASAYTNAGTNNAGTASALVAVSTARSGN